MVFENPFLEPLLVLVKRQIPVGGRFLNEGVARLGIVWINQLFGRECRATFFALVAIGTCGVAVWTFTADITIGEEMSSLRVIELFGCLFDKLTVVIEFAEVVGSELVVNLTGRARIDIE